jgi:hypothetical protein
MKQVVNITEIVRLGDYQLKLTFDDGAQQVIDFKPFLAESLHPDICAWLDKAKFDQYRLCDGELIWGDYELCFPMIDLYRNCIDHRQLRAAA